ncbi:hypothetical protein BCR34DRAFT_585849 [Clohesyomyces aquaticus]|uniref:Uncharacterized protein n=1 Tax=Clohesyomyces aquaticus TaxID=1231657 RepID=A0A1Y1ZW14_9PLEO|nr:hypothetical protein BCR34DRAFT_585849 [Clohesyomyces aquaticus]
MSYTQYTREPSIHPSYLHSISSDTWPPPAYRLRLEPSRGHMLHSRVTILTVDFSRPMLPRGISDWYGIQMVNVPCIHVQENAEFLRLAARNSDGVVNRLQPNGNEGAEKKEKDMGGNGGNQDS